MGSAAVFARIRRPCRLARSGRVMYGARILEPTAQESSVAPPQSGEPGSDARSARARALDWSSTILLLAVFAWFLGVWLDVNWPTLTDWRLQTDDSRTILFPMHRYGPEHALVGDPIADEMFDYMPHVIRALYWVLVPTTGVFLGSKFVQALALLVMLYAGVEVARSKRAGLAGGVLLLFLLLHDWFVVNRVAGGLPRSFGFSALALWLAGVATNRRKLRYSGPILAALTYPSVMNILLAAEGLLAVRRFWRIDRGVVLRRLKRYAVLVGLCFVCVLPAVVGGEDRGAIHTLEEAEKEPAFGRGGRLWILPFTDPLKAFPDAFVDPFEGRGDSPLPAVKGWFQEHYERNAVILLAFFGLLVFSRRSPVPDAALAVALGSIAVYTLSRLLAFRLYSPERYYSFGMHMAVCALVLGCFVHAFYRSGAGRAALRNFSAVAAMLLIWVCAGSGQFARNGQEIDARRERDLYQFVARLPKDARVAGHLLDTDGIPLWSARATTGGMETLQPWFTESWRRQKERTRDTLRALYATDRQVALAFADEYRVTHFLVNRRRYGGDFRAKARSFEPFTKDVRRMLADVEQEDLVLGSVPRSAVVFRSQRFSLVSVEKLRAAWAQTK